MPGPQHSTTQGCVLAKGEEALTTLLEEPPLTDVLENKSKEPMSLDALLRFAKENVSVVFLSRRGY